MKSSKLNLFVLIFFILLGLNVNIKTKTIERPSFDLHNTTLARIDKIMIYDKSGKQTHKNGGFMGVDNMKKWILEIL